MDEKDYWDFVPAYEAWAAKLPIKKGKPVTIQKRSTVRVKLFTLNRKSSLMKKEGVYAKSVQERRKSTKTE